MFNWKRSLPVMLFFLSGSLAYAQMSPADAITGTWLTADKSGQISIFRKGQAYYGRIKGGTSDQHFDIHNPDRKRRNDSLVGLVILKGFVFDGSDRWTEGSIYDPKNGKTYSCILSMPDKNTLRIRGYIGFTWLGRTETWKRID